jgi:hypothetical protein
MIFPSCAPTSDSYFPHSGHFLGDPECPFLAENGIPHYNIRIPRSSGCGRQECAHKRHRRLARLDFPVPETGH